MITAQLGGLFNIFSKSKNVSSEVKELFNFTKTTANPVNMIGPTGMNHHDYKLNSDGSLEKTRHTKDSFDRIFNESGTDNIAVSKVFIDKSGSNGKGMIYPLSSTEAKHDVVSDRIFKFFADNTHNEYGLNTFKDTKTGKSSGFISTSFQKGTEGAGLYERNRRKDSNPNLIVTRDIHSHPTGGLNSDSDYPSGFGLNKWSNPGMKGMKVYNTLSDDAKYYNQAKSKYGNRISNNFEIYVPKAKNVKIFYNDKKATRTNNGIPY